MNTKLITINSLSKLFSFICLIVFVCACSDNDSNKPSKNQEIETQQSSENIANTTNKEQINETQITPEEEKSEDDTEEVVVKTENIVTEEISALEESPSDKIKRQLQELETNLYSNSQENAALRQHIDLLIKKIEENQRALKEFDSQQTESN